MAEHRADPLPQELRRIPANELAYPVLLIQRESFFVWRDASSLRPLKGSLIDRLGVCYRMEDLHNPNPFFRDGQLLSRAERRRLVSVGIPSADVCYSGEPVQVSLNQVREKIVWLVSARGHFEIPQGLPSLAHVESVEALLSVLLAAGWSSYNGFPRTRC